MPGFFDDIPVAAKPPPKSAGLFDDIPVAAKTAPKTAAPPAAAPAASPYENEKTPLDTLKRVVKGVLNIPKAAFEASEERRQGGDYDPAPIVDAATLAVGPSVAGVRLGLKATPKAGEAPKPSPEAPKAPAAAKPEAPKPVAAAVEGEQAFMDRAFKPDEAPKAGGPPGSGPPPGKGMFDDIPAAKQPPIKEQVVNLSDDLQKIKQSGVADRAEIGNKIQQAPKEILDKDLQEKFYHAIEDPKKMAE